ncbi:hypothetical protein [Gluconacetobacter asukensis]|uniref:Uncharacterized protein n=1 Tax=Gluconacetobacter asukensis TaxID=1017181 RepID=A0A7W4J1E0_9PROT|nr:hypothetical protein [Gluconacetobacter asukensis]MBB2172852.1 hypothetical protein [Gluconacetobacter asukensis]
MSHPIDMTGRVIGNRRVLGLGTAPATVAHPVGRYWRTECLECGDIQSVSGGNLRNRKPVQCRQCANGTLNAARRGKGAAKLPGYKVHLVSLDPDAPGPDSFDPVMTFAEIREVDEALFP